MLYTSLRAFLMNTTGHCSLALPPGHVALTIIRQMQAQAMALAQANLRERLQRSGLILPERPGLIVPI